jgi:hypothetical protein
MWRVSWQDYRGWRTVNLEEKRPQVGRRDFNEKAEAEKFANLCRDAGLMACVSPAPGPRYLGRKHQTAISDPPFNANWKLHA